MTQLIPKKNPTLETIEWALKHDPQLPSPHTQRGYWRDLQNFEEWRAGRPFTKLLVAQYATELQQRDQAPATINRALAAIRWWARRLQDLAYESPDIEPVQRRQIVTQAARVDRVQDVRGDRLPKGRHVAASELSALLATCWQDEKPSGIRDAALLSLAWMAGLRCAELMGVQWADITIGSEEEFSLRILGKGNKERVAYLHGGALLTMQDWLHRRGEGAGALFCPVLKSGKLQVGRAISTRGLNKILAKRAKEAGLSQPIMWHDFRRTFAGNLLDAGHDLVTVQQLMGHASPTTTSRYDRRGDASRRRAIQSLYVPYRGER